MGDIKTVRQNCKDAVCVDAGRVYDSCSDKDCLENMRVFFTERDQMIVDHAVSIRTKKADILTTYIDVEPLPFNRGYYACDITFLFEVEIEALGGRCAPVNCICGVGVFRKKVILYGSEGHVRVFCSEYRAGEGDTQEMPTQNMPRCSVQVAAPVILDARLVDCCDRCHYDCGDCSCIPAAWESRYGGCFVDCADSKLVFVSIGIFTIVQLIRNVQMLMPVYDYCMPSKECTPNTENPCELFRKMHFPVGEFFPPAEDKEHDCGCGCGCDKPKDPCKAPDDGCRRGY